MRYLIVITLLSLTFAAPEISHGQPMVVYSTETELFVGTGEAGSFSGVNQGSVIIKDLAIDPSTRAIYYLDTLNGNIGIANSSGQRTGILTETPSNPLSISIHNGILYYLDGDLTPSIQTVNLSTLAEGSLPIADAIKIFAIDTKNGRVFYGTASSTDERVKSSDFNGANVTEFFRPSTGTSDLEVYGGFLLRADFGNSARITSFILPNLNSSTVVRQTSSGSGRIVDMAADSENGVYYYLKSHAENGGLYRRTLSQTGAGDETLIEAISVPIGLDALEADSQVLKPGTVLTAPPVLLSSTSNSVTLQLLEFEEVELPKKSKKRNRRSDGPRVLRAKSGPVLRYEVKVKSSTGKTIKSLLAKRNEVTVKNLKPGNYSTNYRASIYVKKNAAQKAKAKASGKKGIALTLTKKFSTNFSPSLDFSIQ